MKLLLNRLRLSRGLFWKSDVPPIPFRDLAVIVACVLVYGAVDKFDRLTERMLEAEEAAEIRGASQKVLHDCMSGASGFYYPDTKQTFSCEIHEI